MQLTGQNVILKTFSYIKEIFKCSPDNQHEYFFSLSLVSPGNFLSGFLVFQPLHFLPLMFTAQSEQS